ncbi:MAG: ligand-binding sensor domain-containing protein [Janthinobacterium lividum]
MTRFSAWFCFLLALSLRAGAQGVAFGDWQLHLPARRPLLLADAGTRLYVADESSFYFYDKTTNSTQLLSRRDGLSDVGVAALAYDSASAQLVVVYKNGNIDLLGRVGAVRNITDLLRKTSQTAKGINQVQIYNGLAYIDTTLGIVVIDLAKREVRDTYSAIGAGGASVNAYTTVVLHDTIFASTSLGLLRSRISPTVNLLDYRNWTTETPVSSSPNQYFNQAVAYRGHLYVGSGYRGVDYLAGVGTARAWHYLSGSYGNSMRRLRPSAVGLLIVNEGANLLALNSKTGTLTTLLAAADVGRIIDAVREDDGTYFIASYDKGLLRFGPGITKDPEVIKPNSPATTEAFGLTADAHTNAVVVFPGGYLDNTTGTGQRGFFEYQNGQWTNYNTDNYPSLTDYPNLVNQSHGAFAPDGTLYVASYGNGLLQWHGPGNFKQYTVGNSPLLSTVTDPADPFYREAVRVSDVAVDPTSGGPVWVVNFHQRAGQTGLFRFYSATSTWKATPYFSNAENLNRIAVDNFGNAWATTTRKGAGTGLVAFDTTSQRAFAFQKADGLPSNDLYAVVRDRKGAIWVGTGAGVAVLSDPSQIISAAANGTAQGTFAQPVVTRGAGTGYQALYNETVRCIAVDGANRKWFGTPNGLWLFSADATEALLNFTTANSPLPSNSIVDVAVNDKTGEVFVATDGGVVSYQGSATLTEGSPTCAQVSPNPVRPEFTGTMGIKGVANDAQVRITDIAGHLVYTTKAAGGTVTWNLQDTAGRRVRSGVYLVLTADADGKNTCVSKVAVL